MIKKIFSSPLWNKWGGTPICFLSLLLSFCLALVMLIIVPYTEGTLLGKLINSVNEEWYMNTFFDDRNSKCAVYSGDEDIVIIDIKESFSSRDEIAYVLRKISSLKPRVICVDFLFSDNTSYDAEKNVNLQKTIGEIKDTTNIVVVAYKGQQSVVEQSYFMDSLHLDYGLADFVSYSEFVPYISDSIPRITTKIAEKINVNVYSLPNPIMINYRHKGFTIIPVKDSTDVKDHLRDDLKNKIILLGQYNSPEDVHLLPFVYKGIKQISGIEIIANEISSLLSYHQNNKFDKYYYPYTYFSWLQNAILYAILAVVYMLILYILYGLVKNEALLVLIKPLLLFLVEYLLIWGCFWYTENEMEIPNLVLFATSILFVGFFYELIYTLIKKYQS